MVALGLQALGVVFSGVTAYSSVESNDIAKENQRQHKLEQQAQSSEGAFQELDLAVKKIPTTKNTQTMVNEDH